MKMQYISYFFFIFCATFLWNKNQWGQLWATQWFDEEGFLAGTKCPCPSSYPQPYRLYLIQPCLTSIPAVQYSLICHVSNANFNVLPSHMLWKKESATVMLWLLSNPQLNKHRGHLQVGRHWDVCLSRLSTSLPLLQLTPYLSNAKGKRRQELTTATSHCDLHSQSCSGWLRNLNDSIYSIRCVSTVKI